MTLNETAYAKINLALHVRRRRDDGYHDLESLFAFAEDGDLLSATAADELSLSISGPFGTGLSTGADNLVMRAASRLKEAFGIASGAKLHLEKNLPVASGIGGGSADAAAALRLLSKLWNLDKKDSQISVIAKELGADVPACLESITVRGDAKGDQLTPVAADQLTGMPLLLVNPGWPVSTPEIFANWDRVDRGALNAGDPMAAALAGRNDLTDAAVSLVPEIADVLELLGGLSGLILARMSGSGATCFALFESIAARDVGAAIVAMAMPDAWCLSTKVR